MNNPYSPTQYVQPFREIPFQLINACSNSHRKRLNMCKIEVSVFIAICYVHKNIQCVNPFYGNVKFLYPLKTLLIFSGGKEMKHWCEIGQPNILIISTLTYLLPAFYCLQSPLVALIVPSSNIPKVMQFVPQHCRKVTTTVLILSSIQKQSTNPA